MQINTSNGKVNKYTAPSSDLIIPVVSNKPIKAVVYALLISILGISIFSMVISTVFAVANQIDAANATALRNATASSVWFLIMDLVGSFAFLLVAGRIIAKLAPAKKIACSILVTAIVVMIFGGALFFDTAATSTFPAWYISSIVMSMVVGVPLGVKLTASA